MATPNGNAEEESGVAWPFGKLRVILPKFKVSSSMSLTSVAKALGASSMFGPGADFGRLAKEPLFVSDVVHKAVVEVDEEGTVAAAGARARLHMCTHVCVHADVSAWLWLWLWLHPHACIQVPAHAVAVSCMHAIVDLHAGAPLPH